MDEPPRSTELQPTRLRLAAEGREVLERLSELAPYAVVLFELQGRIVLANSRAEEFFGYPRDELLGVTVDLLLPHLFQNRRRRAREGHRDRLSPEVSATEPERELYGRRKNGTEIVAAVSLNRFEVDGNGLVLALVRDKAEHSPAEQHVLKLPKGISAATGERLFGCGANWSKSMSGCAYG